MGADLFKTDPVFRGWVRRASDRVGADLEHVCLRGPDRELTRTRHLQPLLVCVSLGYWHQLNGRGLRAEVVLGHSLGEISALAAAGVVGPEDAVDIAVRRGALMEEAAAATPGGMIAVMPHEREPFLDWLAARYPDGRVVFANDNAPGQLVLSGGSAALDEAAHAIVAEKLGAVRKLSVSGPWHSPLLRDAQRQFGEWLASVPFHPPRVPLICNTSGAVESDPARIRDQVVRNLAEPVLWCSCMDRLKAMQPGQLLEVGPGRVLAGLARANGFGDATHVHHINNLRGVNAVAA